MIQPKDPLQYPGVMFGLFPLIVYLTVVNVFSAVPVLILFGNVSRETHAGDMFDVFLTEMAEYSQ